MRPVATVLTMIAILLAGALAYRHLPVSALPQVDYPTIQVLTFYPGAGPDVMTSSITAPAGTAVRANAGLNQMTSTSSGGSSVVTLQFSLDIDLDVAEQEVQAAMNSAATFLLRDLPAPPVYNKVNPADAPILTLALTSATLPLPQVRDFAETRFAQKNFAIVRCRSGEHQWGQRPAVRIRPIPRVGGLWLDVGRSPFRGGCRQRESGQRRFDGPRRASIINATDQLFAGKDYKALIVAYRNGAPVRLSEVAEVIDDVENTKQAAWMNETPAVIVNIQRQPGTNVIEVVDREEVAAATTGNLAVVGAGLRADRPHDLDSRDRSRCAVELVGGGPGDPGDFFVSPHIARHGDSGGGGALSLIGTFGVMYLMGFSLNNLTFDGADDLHGLRGRRCHRDDREHCAIHRTGNRLSRLLSKVRNKSPSPSCR